MNLLLDTHVFMWWDLRDAALTRRVRSAIEEPHNAVFVSAASVWEIATKRRLGKLAFDGSVSAAISANGFLELPILPAEAEAAGDLAWRHADPFDRILVAQAMAQELVFVTADETIRAFEGVARLWAK